MAVKQRVIMGLCIAGGVLLAFYAAIRPSNQRDWTLDQAVLPKVIFEGTQVRIENIRNFNYRSVLEYDAAYYEQTYDPAKVNSVWLMLEPFAAWEGMAHVLLTFGFSDHKYLAVSIEIRKEKGETFSPWKGLLKQYELMYVIGDERDLIRLRANYRKNRVYVFPLEIPAAQQQALLLDILQRAQQVAEKPEFYNTLFNTCATNIVWHINRVWPGRLPWDWRVYAPGYLDRFFHEQGFVATPLPNAEIRSRYQINARSLEYDQSIEYSLQIRKTDTVKKTE